MKFLNYIFKRKKEEPKSRTIFIVEDNNAYAQALKVFLTENFPELQDVKIFPVGEVAEMELDRNPAVIIMDYFLDSKYSDAETGLEAVEHIRSKKPLTNIMLLSSQDNMDIALEATKKFKCFYVKKDHRAFQRVHEYIKEVL